jgi:glycosyltransferase involved in cell wall biosynthesis
MNTSRVGMGMPVYNGERYLEESLRANLAQTYGDFRLFIADNASTDRTEEICRDYAARDKRITYIRNPVNVGAPGNYARCFHPAVCEYFRWANSDDLPEPTLLEKCVAVLDADPSTVLAYGKTRIIDEHGALMQEYDDDLNLRQDKISERFIDCLVRIGLNNVMYGLIRRDKLARTALLKGYLAADINLVAEISLYGKFQEIPEILFSRRMHPQASSWDRKDAKRQRDFWDPRKRKLVMQSWRRLYEYYRAVFRAPMPVAQRAAILYYLLRKTAWARNDMAHELGDLVQFGILRSSSGTPTRAEEK